MELAYKVHGSVPCYITETVQEYTENYLMCLITAWSFDWTKGEAVWDRYPRSAIPIQDDS